MVNNCTIVANIALFSEILNRKIILVESKKSKFFKHILIEFMKQKKWQPGVLFSGLPLFGYESLLVLIPEEFQVL